MNVTNAKFKVGDVVEVVGDGLATKGKQGVIYKINEANKAYPYKVRIGTDYNNMYGDAELRKVMHNAVRSTNAVVAKALNAVVAMNVKSYPFYVVDKAMKGKCIFSGRYELSDANDDVAELKKSGVESKAVPRRVLLMSGIDPDEESSWKKNHKKD